MKAFALNRSNTVRFRNLIFHKSGGVLDREPGSRLGKPKPILSWKLHIGMPLSRYAAPVRLRSAEFWGEHRFWDLVILDEAVILIIATLTDI